VEVGSAPWKFFLSLHLDVPKFSTQVSVLGGRMLHLRSPFVAGGWGQSLMPLNHRALGSWGNSEVLHLCLLILCLNIRPWKTPHLDVLNLCWPAADWDVTSLERAWQLSSDASAERLVQQLRARHRPTQDDAALQVSVHSNTGVARTLVGGTDVKVVPHSFGGAVWPRPPLWSSGAALGASAHPHAAASTACINPSICHSAASGNLVSGWQMASVRLHQMEQLLRAGRLKPGTLAAAYISSSDVFEPLLLDSLDRRTRKLAAVAVAVQNRMSDVGNG
jgi:hypothetical protein